MTCNDTNAAIEQPTQIHCNHNGAQRSFPLKKSSQDDNKGED